MGFLLSYIDVKHARHDRDAGDLHSRSAHEQGDACGYGDRRHRDRVARA